MERAKIVQPAWRATERRGWPRVRRAAEYGGSVAQGSDSLFGEQNKGVGGERRQAQRLFRHGDPAAAMRHVPGRVHQVLGLVERIAGRAAIDA